MPSASVICAALSFAAGFALATAFFFAGAAAFLLAGFAFFAPCRASCCATASSTETVQPSRGARCLGYLEGFVDGYAISDHLAETVGVKLNAFCLPKSRDLTSRLVRSVLAHLDRQPPNPEGSTATLVAAALSRTFPCTELLEPRK